MARAQNSTGHSVDKILEACSYLDRADIREELPHEIFCP
jgi:hypothetical protein